MTAVVITARHVITKIKIRLLLDTAIRLESVSIKLGHSGWHMQSATEENWHDSPQRRRELYSNDKLSIYLSIYLCICQKVAETSKEMYLYIYSREMHANLLYV